jgi:hypothetical protein
MKKKLVLSAMLVCLLALGLGLAGCPTEDDDSGGGAKLPGNLQNTKWENNNGYTLEFKTDQIILIQDSSERTFNVVSATENGQIMASEVYGSYVVGDEEKFCSSYTINGTTLDLQGDRSFSGIWTKSSPDTGGGSNSLVGTWEMGGMSLTFRADDTWDLPIGGVSGTYTLSGTTLTMTDTEGTTAKGTVTFSGSTVTLSDFTGQPGMLNGTWTKR